MITIPWHSILFQILLAAGGIILFAIGALTKKRSHGLLFTLSLLWILAAGVAAIMAADGPGIFLRMLDVSSYGRFFNLLLAGIAVVALLFAHQNAHSRQVAGDEFFGLMLFATLGMSLVAAATHWLMFFLGFELLSLAFYVLIAVSKEDPQGNEAGLKYLVMGMVAGGFLAFGIAVLYAVTGTLDIPQSLMAVGESEQSSGGLLALGLILVAVGFKISLVPFHPWTPDVYQGAPTPVTAFLATGSKIAVFAGLLRLVEVMPDRLWGDCVPVLWGLAAATMIVGDVTALVQIRLKRLLAYSSIAQMGYVLMGLLAVRGEGGPAVVFYFATYVLAELGAFGVIATLNGEHGEDLDNLDHYQGIGYSHPWQAFVLSVCLLSLAGIPPTAGFISKFLVFEAVLGAGYVVLDIIAILAVIVSIYIYLKVLVVMYMHPADQPVITTGFGLASRCGLAVIVAGTLWLGVSPSLLYNLITDVLTLFRSMT
jgi:NADH-quinone oxidoreductase subunit N